MTDRNQAFACPLLDKNPDQSHVVSAESRLCLQLVDTKSHKDHATTIDAWWSNPVVPGLLVYLAAGGLLSLRPSILAWAFEPWASLTPVVRYGIIGLGVFACLPVVTAGLDRVAGSVARAPGITYIFVLLAGTMFVVFRVRNYAIGDGYLLLGYLRDWNLAWFFDQFTQLTSQLGDLLLIWIIGQNIVLPLGYEWADCYVVVGTISGLLGLWAIVRFSRFVASDRATRLLVVFGCLSAGTVYMWFGHVESYTPSFVAGLWTCVLAVEASHHRTVLKWAWLTLIVAVLFHSISLCLLPVLVYASLASRIRDRLRSFASPALFVIGGFVAAGIGATIVRALGLKIFVPVLPTSETVYAAFAIDHLLDMVNVLVRIAPLSLIALPLLWRGHKPKSDKLRQARTALAIAAAGTWYFIFWVDPTLGALRDWDLLSLASFPLTLWAITVIATRPDIHRRISPAWVAAAVLAIVHIGVLVAANRDANHGAEAMDRLLRDDTHLSGAYYKGARLIPWGTTLLRAVDRPDLAIEYYRRRTVAEPTDVIAWRNLGWSEYLVGDPPAARKALETGLRLDSTNVMVLSYLGLADMMLGDWTAARDIFTHRMIYLPWDVESLYGAGLACAYLGEDSVAGDHLANAIGLNIAARRPSELSDRDSLLAYSTALVQSYADKRMSLDRMIVYSELCLLTNDQEQSVRAAEAAAQHAPEDPDARRPLVLCMSLLHADTLAMPHWTWYRQQRPHDAVALLLTGIVARRLGQTQVAIDCLTDAAESATALALPCFELAELYGELGDIDNALRWSAEADNRTIEDN